MIELKEHLPRDIARPVWDELERLVLAERWKLYERVAQEVHDDKVARWFQRNPGAIVPFSARLNEYLNRFMLELEEDGLMMVDPTSPRDDGDPFVVVLALMLEDRSLLDLRQPAGTSTCCVISEERRRGRRTKIPFVCDHYSLACMTLLDFMRHHGWRLGLTVGRPE
jgi:hypothetical protein